MKKFYVNKIPLSQTVISWFSIIIDISDLNKCGGNIQLNEKESKAIYSPGFPLLYPQGLNCTWSVESTKYVIIEIGTLELQSRTEITDLVCVLPTFKHFCLHYKK